MMGCGFGKQISVPFIYLTAYSDTATIKRSNRLRTGWLFDKNHLSKRKVFAAISLALKNYEKSDENQVNSENVNNHYNLKGELVIKEGAGHYKINIKDILFIRAEKQIYLYTYSRFSVFVLRTALTRFLEEYNINLLHRVHKSYAINIDRIKSYSGGVISMGEQEIPLSRSYKKSFFDTMATFKIV